MKFLLFGKGKRQHRLAFVWRRGRRVLHSKCGVRMGANDQIIVSENSDDFGCEKCAQAIKQKKGKYALQKRQGG